MLKSHVPVSHKKFVSATLLKSLADRGQIFLVKKGRSSVAFRTDPFAEIDTKLPGHAARDPIEKESLKDLVGAAAPGYETVFDLWLRRALAERKLYEHAPAKPKRKKRIGRDPDVRSSLAPAIKALTKALAKLDAQRVPRERVAEVLLATLGLPGKVCLTTADEATKATTSTDAAPANVRSRFIAALETLANDNPRDALLSVRALRSRAGLNKQQFDTIAIALALEGVVSLHHHDHAQALPEAERAQLIQDDRGTYFNGIAPRRGT